MKGVLRLRQKTGSEAGLSSLDETASAGRKKRKKKSEPPDVGPGVVLLKKSLAMLHDSSDACPPLKSTTGGLMHIIKVLEVRADTSKKY